MTNQPTYKTDPILQPFHGCTGIYVRAQTENGEWGNADIAELMPESLEKWAKTINPEDLARILVQQCREWQYEAAMQAFHRENPKQFTAKQAEKLPDGTLIYDRQGDYWEKQNGTWDLYQHTTTCDTLPEDGQPYTLIYA